MSKARGNVVNPDDIVRDYGADTFRLCERYMGPLEAQKPWNTRDIVGMSRFLHAVWRNLTGTDEDADGARVADPHTPSPDGGAVIGAASAPPPVGEGRGQASSPSPASSTSAARIADPDIPDALDRQRHRAIRKVADDIETLRFNTAIAELIKLNNELTGLPSVPRSLAERFT